MTMLAFLIKACVAALKKFPDFNASLDGDNLIVKRYYNIGFAADTPNGLVVPVVKDADRKGVHRDRQRDGRAVRRRRARASSARRHGGRQLLDLSLGGIGGTALHADRQRARGGDPRRRRARR